ncbi:alpha/beta hydrolase fold domain-containing protein [Luminiphilus sp. nBUS_16]|uniref:alpha/beta hydrolase fold domain-containing protein n=1 Tax=Luminiphilus sp. nBUS_16 TaxID=3395315 RepID=UPI003EB87EFC
MMKSTVFTLWLLSCVAQVAHAADEWEIAKRRVPPPAGASEQLRKSIARTSAPAVSGQAKAPQTNAQWHSAQMQEQEIEIARIARWADTLGVQIEEKEVAGIPVFLMIPLSLDESKKNQLFIHLHGGAYVFGGGRAGIGEGLLIANRLTMPVVSIDYRMPPENPFPAAINDVVDVYKNLLESYAPEKLAIGGSSAGGGLALASVHKFALVGLPFPGAIYAGTPWADLSKTGDTLFTLEGVDQGLVTYEGVLESAAKLYVADNDFRSALVSPVYGSFSGFPPTILISGTRDMFLSDTVRTHRKLRGADVVSDLHVYEGMAHAQYLYDIDSPESLDVFAELQKFMSEHLQ